MCPLLEDSLPEDILDAIVALCCPSTLATLCRASRRLNCIAMVHLWSRITLHRTQVYQGSLTHLLPIAYRIFSSPNRAALIKSVAIPQSWATDDEGPVDDSAKRPWPVEGAELENVLHARCLQFIPDQTEANDLFRKIRHGTQEDEIVALLIACLPRLQCLEVNFDTHAKYPAFFNMLERCSKSPFRPVASPPVGLAATIPLPEESGLSFSAPIDIMVRGTSEVYPNDPARLAPFFHIPTLRSIYAWNMGDEDWQDIPGEPFTHLAPHSSAVASIELRRTKLHSSNLRRLLDTTIPGRLQAFSYEIGGAWAGAIVHHAAIMDALQPHRPSLARLALSHEPCYPYQCSASDQPAAVSFAPFAALQGLKVAPVYIWGDRGLRDAAAWRTARARDMLWKALPASLRELWIVRACPLPRQARGRATAAFVPDCLLPALEGVLRHRAEAFPELVALRVEFSLLEWKEAWLERLTSFCREAVADGVGCTVICTRSEEAVGGVVERNWGWEEDVVWHECSAGREPGTVWIDVAADLDLLATLKGMRKEMEVNHAESWQLMTGQVATFQQ